MAIKPDLKELNSPANRKEIEMEQILKNLTLDFFGKGKHKITPEKFFEIENVFLLDVRSKEEASSISIRMENHSNVESVNIPINEIPDRINEIPKEKFVAVFCPASVRSAIVYAYLLSKGFSEVRIVEGGYVALTEALKPGQILKIIQSKK
ncbi:MAG: rhodanese-like domain-containing protein [Thermodesulfobacteriota bacterium]|nr:rhodanese-like domain-containing protein [Thermodesulfobacteriota bacterium]